MPRHPLRSQAQHDARVLDAAIRIEQLGAHRTDVGPDGQRRHRLQPAGLDHQDIVVDEGQQPRPGLGGGGIVEG